MKLKYKDAIQTKEYQDMLKKYGLSLTDYEKEVMIELTERLMNEEIQNEN